MKRMAEKPAATPRGYVRELGLREADDSVIWEYAKVRGFCIVSKDSDFQQRSLLLGAPPKFIWLRLGNCSVTDSHSRQKRGLAMKKLEYTSLREVVIRLSKSAGCPMRWKKRVATSNIPGWSESPYWKVFKKYAGRCTL